MSAIRLVVVVEPSTDPADLELTVGSAKQTLAVDDEIVLVTAQDPRSTELASRHVGGQVRALGSSGSSRAELIDLAVSENPQPGRNARFVAFVRPGVELLPLCLEHCRSVLDQARAGARHVDVLYGDHIRHVEGSPEQAMLRPGWSPDRLRVDDYLGPFVLVRTELLVGLDFSGRHEPASRHDLLLRASERAELVVHVSELLTRCQDRLKEPSDPVAVAGHLQRLGLPMTVAGSLGAGPIRLEPALETQPKVSLIVLTGGALRDLAGRTTLLVLNAVGSLLRTTDYDDFEVVVVLDRHAPDALGEQLRALDPDRVRIVRDTEPFNFSAANNLGVNAASGDVVVFVNDDVEVRAVDWLERIVMHLGVPGVGIVGARLLFGDGRVQHAGLTVKGGFVEHRFGGYLDGPGSTPAAIENLSAVTGAVLGITRTLFDAVGGFPEEFPLNFNDVALCFEVRSRGFRVLVDHDIVLTHYETSSRSAGITDDEQARFVAAWPEASRDDLYGHPDHLAVRAEPIAPPAALIRLRRVFHPGAGAR